ncbi:hypothetical protein AGMMS50267_00180 [Spirochaetia bacterium]|nr:hypothetical protein AGMMS50267_00180 [Spirochaetia bacterium]
MIAAEVDIDETSALWLDGIPPVRQTKVSINSRPLRFLPPSSIIAALNNWASKKLDTDDRKIGFSINVLTCSVRMDIANDLT